MSSLTFERRGERWVVRDRLTVAHLRFEPWGRQLRHCLGADLSSLPGNEFGRDHENVVASCDTEAATADHARTPGSPVFEEITHRTRRDQHELMVVGRFGKHHYAGVFTARSEPNGMLVEVDVVDRCREGHAGLVVTYRLKNVAGELAYFDRRRAAWSGLKDDGHVRWSVQVEPPGRLRLVEISEFGTTIQIVGGDDGTDATRRCRYAWLCGSNPELELTEVEPPGPA